VVDLTCDSDDETDNNGPSTSKKSKDSSTDSKSSDSSKTGASAKPSEDVKPDIEKLKEHINKVRTVKEIGVQTEEREVTSEERNYKKRLLSFQKNVHELLRRIDPSKEWGGPENIEGIIVQMMKHIEPSGEMGDSE
jgi:hypothetical protein